jgi:hypothetical protein
MRDARGLLLSRWGLIGIGGLSGVALFIRAVFSNMKDAETAVGTLWGLLFVGLVAGFILLKVAEHSVS